MAAAVLLTVMLAQTPVTTAGESEQLARVRRALAEPPARLVPPLAPAQGPIFRVNVFGRKADPLPWANWSPVPSNIRPWFRADHHEFLERVTTERFRSATLYPVGIPVLAIAESLAKSVKAAHRKKQEANAKDEVRQALEELLTCRANPDRPGCY